MKRLLSRMLTSWDFRCLQPSQSSLVSGLFGTMALSIDESVRQIGPSRWYIGSLVCERINKMQYADAVAAWEEDERTYILRKAKDNEITPPAAFADWLSDDVRLVHTGGTLSAVWMIGRRVFCKV